MATEQCCPRLDPAEWEKQEFHWREKPFYKTKYRSIFHIPLNIRGVTTRAIKEIEGRGLAEEPEMMLSKEESAFSSTLLLSLKQAPPDLPVEKLSGTYVSRLFQGKYRETPKWIKAMKSHLRERGSEAKELLLWYVTCPRCIKKYGTAQTVIFARVNGA